MSESEGRAAGAGTLSPDDLPALVARVAHTPPAARDRDQVEQLEALERLKAAAAAAQATITCRLADTRTIQADARAALDAAAGGLPPLRRPSPDAGTAQEVALARRESPHAGRGHLSLARALMSDLPETYAALARGDISERRAQIVATETRDLTRELRLVVDAELASDLPWLGDRRLVHAVRRIVLRIDEEGALRRRATARRRRRVTCRPLGDGVAQISAVVSDLHAAAIMTSLAEVADTRHAQAEVLGEDRTRGQIIADTFVERLLGRPLATAAPVAVKLVVSAETLVGDDPEPGEAPGVGPVPASDCRAWVRDGQDAVRSTFQRIFAMPATGALVALERTRRDFPADLRDCLEVRDRLCRTPWCDAPVRHGDHVRPHRSGGPTSVHNGEGLCEACNYAKESGGWRHEVVSDPLSPHAVEIITPTGHRHTSTAPGLPRPGPDDHDEHVLTA